jgi:tRNA(His) guanylyltransferase
MNDALGDRMKLYEGLEAGRRLLPLVPVLVRIDGRSFGTFTRDLARPFEPGLSRLMIETTRHLVAEANARIGYTQSDEITLVLCADALESAVYFDGRVQKMVSQLAAQATAVFNHLLPRFLPGKKVGLQGGDGGPLPTFDCRVWTVPSRVEAVNALIWREQDAARNSVESAARAAYSHAEVMHKHTGEMKEMLRAKGVDWDAYPVFFKRGTYVQRRVVRQRFTTDELERLPPKHAARQNPELEFERTEYAVREMPPLATVTNREAVVFAGEPPRVADGIAAT